MSITRSESAAEFVQSMDREQLAEYLGRTGELARVVVRHLDDSDTNNPAADVARLRGLLAKYVTRGTPLG
jgi:hypothetical protein